MPLYEFRCPEGTSTEASFSMASAPDVVDCPCCGGPARRRMGVPRLSIGGSAAFGLIDRAERSAHEPDVVTSLPGAGRRAPRYTSNPLHQKLPRS
ncbi:zinc ribbon domain-containing protein [Zafaria sp. Z1313]|uniref:FmdB family zinc ribbon protein n=1 Tax=unclassified Zafaria TaxID=2828765 RepID=UPI002E76EE55|nr:zinc ribbon domain-containing protein [Zafaria sp. J156]MEE1621737.1 zinc ribbon domain-containing protein [Zafaria sp. J156]